MASEQPEPCPSPSRILEEVLKAAQASQVAVGNKQGFFIDKKIFTDATKLHNKYVLKLDELGIDPATDPLVTQYATIKKQKEMAEATLKEEQKNLTALREEHAKMLAQKDSMMSKRGEVNMLTKSNKAFKAQLEELQRELGIAKARSKSAGKGFDPEAMQKAAEQEDFLRAQVKEMQKQRKDLDVELKTAQAQAADHALAMQKKTAELAAAEAKIAHLKSANAATTKGKLLAKSQVQINMPLVKTLFGEEALKKLQELDYRRRLNLRDYAYTLLQVANNSAPAKGLVALLKLALEWLKAKTYSAREALRPWLDKILADLASARLQTMKFYREALEAIIQDFKAAKAKASSDHAEASGTTKGAFTFLDFVKRQYQRLKQKVGLWARIRQAGSGVARLGSYTAAATAASGKRAWALAQAVISHISNGFSEMIWGCPWQPTAEDFGDEILLFDNDHGFNEPAEGSEPKPG